MVENEGECGRRTSVILRKWFSLERQSPGDERVENGEDDQAVDEEAKDDGGEVPAQLHQHLAKVAHAQHLEWSKLFGKQATRM